MSVRCSLGPTRLLNGSRTIIRADAVVSGVVPQEFASWSDTLGWRRQEWENLKAIMFAAIARGWERLALFIPMHLYGHLLVDNTHRYDSLDMFEAVQGFGSAFEQGSLRIKLAGIYEDVGRLDDALRCFDAGLPLVRAEGRQYVVAAALINQAKLYGRLERHDEAEANLREAITIAIEIDDAYLQSVCHGNLASRLNRAGRPAEALRETDLAAELAARVDDEYLAARLRGWRAAALLGLGRHAEAEPELRAVAEVLRRVGNTEAEAEMLELLGDALIGLKRADEAVVAWQRTISIWRDVRDERADALIARLEALR